MKTLKLIIVLLIGMAVMNTAIAQVPTENKVKLGAFPIWSFTNIDSAVTQTASAYDCSLFKYTTMYYSFLYDGGSNDSVQILIKGKLTNTSSETLIYTLDTVYAKSDVIYNVAASWTAYFDWVYPVVVPWNGDGTTNDGDVTDNGTLRFAIIGMNNANLNVVRSWWQNK